MDRERAFQLAQAIQAELDGQLLQLNLNEENSRLDLKIKPPVTTGESLEPDDNTFLEETVLRKVCEWTEKSSITLSINVDEATDELASDLEDTDQSDRLDELHFTISLSLDDGVNTTTATCLLKSVLSTAAIERIKNAIDWSVPKEQLREVVTT